MGRKTNWLEAIALLATTRSFRTAKPQDAVRFGERLAFVNAIVEESAEISRKLQVSIEGGTKTLSVNDNERTRKPLSRTVECDCV